MRTRIRVTPGERIPSYCDAEQEKVLRQIEEIQRNAKPVNPEGQTTFGMRKDIKAIDKAVPIRELDPEQVSHFRANRTRRAFAVQGHKELPELSPERKEKAVNAFMYSLPAPLSEGEKTELVSLTRISPITPVEPEPLVPRSKFVRYWKEGLITLLLLIGAATGYFLYTRPVVVLQITPIDGKKL